MTICLERYLALVKLYRVKRQYALYVLASSALGSILITVLHFFPEGSAVISSSGLYCFPTRLQAWQGAFDTTAMIIHFVSILVGYLMIYLQLRKLARRAASSMNFPNLGKSTMANLGHRFGLGGQASMHGKVVIHSATATASAIESCPETKSTTTQHPDSPPPITRSVSVQHPLNPQATVARGGPPHYASTVSLAKSMAKSIKQSSSMMISRKTKWIISPHHPEGRVVLRGLLSLAAYSCFVASYVQLGYFTLVHQRRPHVEADWFLVTTRLFPDVCDPIILFLLDRQFRETLLRLFKRK